MSILALADVKTRFPTWDDFVRLTSAETAPAVDARLQQVIDDADDELARYLDVDADTITDPLVLDLLSLIRKRAFDVKHGDTAFEHKPQIVRDYEATIKRLESYQAGYLEKPLPEGETDEQLDVTMTQKKPLIFGEWFR